ncbi:MAG: YbaB/EbfC family nucleoid-associated protein [Rhodospirillales bacterium]|nr:YbaB/EbfC family nucleoid-associated protein [Alphaproteobacteria bacterium]MCB9977483.1 YbaB/EbfC family nucleoid-associated protein [Rhodospirillales bacterium]
MFKRLRQMHYMSMELQAKLEDIDVEADSGDELVKVKMSGAGKLLSVDLNPTIVGWDREVVEDLLLTALNNAVEAKEEIVRLETQKMMKERGLDDETFE